MKSKTYLIGLLIYAATFNILSAQDTTPAQTPSPAQSSQPATEFVITKDKGLTDFIVVNCEGKTKEELYKKTVEWVNKNYNKPSEVIKAQVENDYIRFQGVSAEQVYCSNNMVKVCSNIRYNIEISFKDGKYKFAVLGLEKNTPDLNGNRTFSELNFVNSWTHFKKDGEVRNMYKDAIVQVAGYFNNLIRDLHDYIYNQNKSAKQNDW